MIVSILVRIAVPSLLAALVTGASAPAGLGTPREGGAAITRAYAGDDGGAFYLRQIGTAVYGFGEHPAKKYAVVLKGTLTGDLIDLDWWDVPKGERAEKGKLQLRIFESGAKLVRSSRDEGIGASTFREVSLTRIPWAGPIAAGFQKTTTRDLTGVFEGDDGSRHYVTQTPFNVVWVAERSARPGERPGWVSIFTGKRAPNGAVSGTWADVGKGVEQRSGTFGAAIVEGSNRELRLAQTGASRTKALSPDYAIDWDAFKQRIVDVFEPKGGALAAVGYAFAIAHDGTVVRSGAGGWRRLDQDGGKLPFDALTKAQAGSTAKTISAVALVKALEEHGLTLDTRIAAYLPSCWKKGNSVTSLTFRDVLGHRTGFANLTCPDPYECLRKVIEQGSTEPRTYAYRNINYALLRVIVPFVADRAAARHAFESRNCSNEKRGRVTLNSEVSLLFSNYLFKKALGLVGVKASYFPTENFSWNYDRADATTNGGPPRADFYQRAGAGYLAISATDYARFLSAFDRGEIVSPSDVRSMKADRLGFDNVFRGKAGAYVWKNGICPNPKKGCSALAIIFPGDVQAYLVDNSGNNHAGANAGEMDETLGNAYDAALR